MVLRVPFTAGGLHPIFYLRLGSLLERRYSNDLATQIYRRVYDLSPNSPDTEMALYRMAQILENAYHNHAQALAIYQEMLRLFPAGQMSQAIREALACERIGIILQERFLQLRYGSSAIAWSN